MYKLMEHVYLLVGGQTYWQCKLPG